MNGRGRGHIGDMISLTGGDIDLPVSSVLSFAFLEFSWSGPSRGIVQSHFIGHSVQQHCYRRCFCGLLRGLSGEYPIHEYIKPK